MISAAKEEEKLTKGIANKKITSAVVDSGESGGGVTVTGSEKTVSQKASEKNNETATSAISVSGPVFAKNSAASTVTPTFDSESSDWLCDSCGNQNFAKLPSGLLRSKCFKCQAPKSDACTLVASCTDTSAIAGKNSSSYSSSPVIATKSSAVASSTFSSSANNSGALAVKKITPVTAVTDLRSEKKFVSNAEKDRNELEKRAEQKRKNAYFDALKHANRPIAVLLSPSMRKYLEKALGLGSMNPLALYQSSRLIETPCAFEGEANDLDIAETAALEDIYSDLAEGEGSFTSMDPNGPVSDSAMQAKVGKQLAEYLLGQGFGTVAVIACLRHLTFSEDGRTTVSSRIAKSVLPTSQSKPFPKMCGITCNSAAGFSSVIVTEAMLLSTAKEVAIGYLCLHVSEEDLPTGYAATGFEGKTTLKVFRADSRPHPSARTNGEASRYNINAAHYELPTISVLAHF